MLAAMQHSPAWHSSFFFCASLTYGALVTLVLYVTHVRVCACACFFVPTLLQREFSQTQQLPTILLAPTNAVMTDYLRALQDMATGAAEAGSNGGGSGSADTAGRQDSSRDEVLQQLVDGFSNDTVSSLLLLRRHCECHSFHGSQQQPLARPCMT